jgi:hypothetical protein
MDMTLAFYDQQITPQSQTNAALPRQDGSFITEIDDRLVRLLDQREFSWAWFE